MTHSELLQYRLMQRPGVEKLLANLAHKKLRASFDDHFPPPPWWLFWVKRAPRNADFFEWWHDYLDASITRKHYLRDGWLSGTDYGDY